MTRRVVVIGGDAAGMSAASQAKRLAGDELELVVFERGTYTSYSACGIPYWVSGDVDDRDDLVARSPEEHRRRGVEVHLHSEVTALDLAGRRVEVRDLATGGSRWERYDDLVVATGASPVRPPVDGVDADGVHGIQTLEDGERLLDRLTGRGPDDAPAPRRAVVVGGGYIGIEMAEALLKRGLSVSVVDQAPEPMTTLDPDMGTKVRDAMERMGITVVMDTPVERFDVGGDGRVRAVAAKGRSYAADVVVLGTGVRANAELARRAGLPVGEAGGLRVDASQRVPGHDGVWGAGDCVEVRDRVSGEWRYVPLGTHANKQGRVLGTNLAGGTAEFPGVVQTAVSRVCDLEVGRTGLARRDLERLGLDHVAVTVEGTTRAGYFPGAAPITVKILAERGSRRLLGAQIVGREGSAKRIDVCAIALWAGLGVDELAMSDLSYAPPFSPVWDPVQIAARKAAAALDDPAT